MYKAKCYARINGKTYTKGEIIPDDLPADKIAWLTEAGAIEKTAPAAAKADQEEESASPLSESEETEAEETSEEPSEESEEDVPEIDVMAGIVAEEAEEPKKSAKKPTTRKTAERRKGK